MKQTGPWSVKGIDQRARDIAREAAREEGLTLGEYINRLIIDGHHEGAKEVIRSRLTAATETHRPDTSQGKPAPTSDMPRVLDQLTRRIESSEARSTLAITGIDQSVLGLITRLENAEHSQQMMGADFARTLEDIRSTHVALKDKVAQIENSDASARNLEALKALEVALGRLASHVYEENDALRAQTGEFGNRLSEMEGKVERTLADATESVKSAVHEAELRSEGANRHLADRFASLETSVAERLATVASAPTIDQAQLTEINGALSHMRARLTEAETTTNVALKTLEANFRSLDKRLEALSLSADNRSVIESIQADFDLKFEQLSSDLRTNIGDVRTDFASQIDLLTEMADTSHVEASLSDVHSRLGQIELNTGEAARDAVSKLSQKLEKRVTDLVNQKLPDLEIGRLSDELQQRIVDGEKRNAAAIEQVGEQVASVAQRLQLRQDEALRTMSHQLEDNRRQTDSRLSDALGNVADKLEQVQQQSADQLSPMQRALTSLARRIEAMEDFATPPFSTAPANPSVVPPATTQAETELVSDHEIDGEIDAAIDVDQLIDDIVSEVASDTEEATVADIDTEQAETVIEASEIDETDEVASELEADSDIDQEKTDFAAEIDEEVLAVETDESPATESVDSALEAIAAERITHDVKTDGPALLGAGWSNSNADDINLDDLPPFDDFALNETPPFDDVERAFEDIADAVDEHTGVAPAEAGTFEADQKDEFEDLSREWAASSAVDVSHSDQLSDRPKRPLDPLESLIEWPEDNELDDGRFEPRDSDVFDKESAFEAVANIDPTSSAESNITANREEDPLAFLEPAPVDPTTDEFEEELEEIAETAPEPDPLADYISRARHAAQEATNGSKGPLNQSSEKRNKLMRTVGLSALLLVTAGVASFWMFRQPAQPAPSPVVPSEAAQPSSATPVVAETGVEAATSEAVETETETSASEVTEPSDGGTTVTPETVEVVPAAESSTTTEPAVEPEPEFTVPADPIPRIRSLESAARNGNRIASYQLGLSKIEAGDISPGVALIQQSASAGQPAAQYELARLHIAGLGVSRDPDQAIVWMERAAGGGHVKAMQETGIYYSNPENTGHSNAKAATWFRRAAEFGLVDSQFNLGIMYDQGIGVTADKSEAFFWAMVAAQTGDSDAQDFSEELRGGLSPQAVGVVQTRLANWRAAAPNSSANGVFTNPNYGRVTAGQIMGVQETLRGLGYDIGGVDGKAGQKTITAIKDFQVDRGIAVTGKIDNALIDELNRAAAPLR